MIEPENEQESNSTAALSAIDELTQVTGMFNLLHIGDFTQEEVTEWLVSDQDVQDHEHLSDEGIIEALTEDMDRNDENDQSQEEELDTEVKVKHNEALVAFDACIRWAQQQPETTATECEI